jgi:hypothetical protein
LRVFGFICWSPGFWFWPLTLSGSENALLSPNLYYLFSFFSFSGSVFNIFPDFFLKSYPDQNDKPYRVFEKSEDLERMARALQILNDKEMAIFENAPPGWDDLDGNWSNSGDVRGLCSQGQWTNPGPNAKRHGPESACRLGGVRLFFSCQFEG